MGKQMVGQQYRLSCLQVRLSRHGCRRVSRGLAGQRLDHTQHTDGDPAHGVAQPHPEQRGHLVITGAAGP